MTLSLARTLSLSRAAELAGLPVAAEPLLAPLPRSSPCSAAACAGPPLPRLHAAAARRRAAVPASEPAAVASVLASERSKQASQQPAEQGSQEEKEREKKGKEKKKKEEKRKKKGEEKKKRGKKKDGKVGNFGILSDSSSNFRRRILGIFFLDV